MNMKFYGNAEILRMTEAMVKKGREQRSVIIHGDKGLGKKTFAKYLAALFLCEERSGVPCGKCKACRMLMHGTHPDFKMVEPNANGNYIVDETIRPIVADAAVMPNESSVKVYVIPDLDMSVNTAVQVQNILLKLIEEPPEHVVVILTARSREIFLPTIISRVLSVGLVSVSEKESLEFLHEKYPESNNNDILEAVKAGRGNIGRCEEYLNKGSFNSSVGLARELCSAVCTRSEYNILKAIFAVDSKKQLLRQCLLLFAEIARDACVYRLGDTQHEISVSCDEKGAAALAEALSVQGCTRLYDLLSGYINRIDANCNLSLTINSLAGQISNLFR